MASAPPLAAFVELWGLEVVGGRPDGRPPYPGAGEVAFVRRGREELVLKTLPAGSDEYRSAEVLTHWDGRGAVRLIAEAPGAVLIERAQPGEDLTGLVAAGDDDAATDVLCEVMAQLNRPAPAGAAFRTIVDWGAGFARNRAAAIAAGVDPGLIDRAERTFFDLCATQAPAIVLHGDLQHFNVVRDEARGWLAIDPKGVLGEPAYETGAMLRNPTNEGAARAPTLARRVERICTRLGYPRDRMLGWCFSQWVLSLLWCSEDHVPYELRWLDGPHAAERLLR